MSGGIRPESLLTAEGVLADFQRRFPEAEVYNVALDLLDLGEHAGRIEFTIDAVVDRSRPDGECICESVLLPASEDDRPVAR